MVVDGFVGNAGISDGGVGLGGRVVLSEGVGLVLGGMVVVLGNGSGEAVVLAVYGEVH